MVHAHEESAELATILLGGYGVFALAALLYLRKGAATFPRKLMVVALLLSFIPAGAMGWTANQGGKIRHPEITSAGAPLATNGAGADTDGHQTANRPPESGGSARR